MRRNLILGLMGWTLMSAGDAAFSADLAALRDRMERRVYQSADGQKLPYRLAIPKDYDPAKQYPLIVFLHGAGERGNDNEAQLAHPDVLNLISDEVAAKHPCFLVAPQCPNDRRWAEVDWSQTTPHQTPAEPSLPMRLTLELLDSLQKEFSIDPSRRYATGLSMGGYGTFDLLVRRPTQFAAAVPLCGGADDSKAREIGGAALWIFHGNQDGAVPVARSRSIVAALKKADIPVKYTEYDGAGHDIWKRVYREAELPEWLFSKSRPQK